MDFFSPPANQRSSCVSLLSSSLALSVSEVLSRVVDDTTKDLLGHYHTAVVQCRVSPEAISFNNYQ